MYFTTFVSDNLLSPYTSYNQNSWIWSLILCFSLPQILIFFRSLRLYCFKNIQKPKLSHFLTLSFFETGHTIGLCLLVFQIFPKLNLTESAIITNCLVTFPSILNFLNNISIKNKNRNFLKILLDFLCMGIQVSGVVIWFFDTYNIVLPIGLVLISFGWYENFVSKDSVIPFLRYLGTIRSDFNRKLKNDKNFDRSRDFIYLFLSIWKILVFICTTFGIVYIETKSLDLLVQPMTTWPFYLALINIFVSYFCYILAKFVLKIKLQEFSYAFPIFLTVPLLILTFFLFEKYFFYDPIDLDSYDYKIWSWILWLASQTWLTMYVWSLKCERLAATENLFVSPLYCGLLIDQSLALNRKKHEKEELEEFIGNKENKVRRKWRKDAQLQKCPSFATAFCFK